MSSISYTARMAARARELYAEGLVLRKVAKRLAEEFPPHTPSVSWVHSQLRERRGLTAALRAHHHGPGHEDLTRRIHKLRAEGWYAKDIAKQLGVSRFTVSTVLGDMMLSRAELMRMRYRTKERQERMARVKELRASGVPAPAIAKQVGCSENTVYRWLRGEVSA